MPLVALFDPRAPIPAQVRWTPLLARTRTLEVTLLLPAKDNEPLRDKALAQVRNAIGQSGDFKMADAADAHADAAPPAAAEAAAAAPPPAPRRTVNFEFLDAAAPLGQSVRNALAKTDAAWLLLLVQDSAPRDEWAARLGSELVPQVTCGIALVRMVDDGSTEPKRIVVPTGQAAQARSALRLARQLVPPDGEVTAAYVEPDIGTDAESVGLRQLDNVLHGVLGAERERITARVVVADSVGEGIGKLVAAAPPDLVMIGARRRTLLDERFQGTTPGRLCRQLQDVAVVVLRDELPVRDRLRTRLEDLLQRRVPQLERETRLELTRRVQSSSAWNFDFVTLISLATLIAAVGLLQDSAAVIIGAMLVAPLMTPILGLGLALVQGNTMLAKLALRTIGYGVGTAFGLALLVGWCDGDFTMTSEMLGRGWPGLLDLAVAFVSGLAAAYASSRPGLFSALPGVAIAAALVPPIATSGLAASRGELQLAYGSFLLFFTNMVAIVLAASFSLWAVGVRTGKGEVNWLRHLGNALVVLSVALAVHLNHRTHVGGPVTVPKGCEAAIAAHLPAGVRLVHLAATRGSKHVDCTVRLGAVAPPDADLVHTLAPLLAHRFAEAVSVRLVHEWEALGQAAPK